LVDILRQTSQVGRKMLILTQTGGADVPETPFTHDHDPFNASLKKFGRGWLTSPGSICHRACLWCRKYIDCGVACSEDGAQHQISQATAFQLHTVARGLVR